MSSRALARPETIQVKRSEFRRNQKRLLKKAKGRTVVVVTSRGEGEEKCVLDRRYFEELLKKLAAAIETLEITTDRKLFQQLLRAAETLDDDAQLGRLHSFEEAFPGD